MIGFTSARRSAIGLDVGPRWIRAVQLHRRSGVTSVAAAARLPRTAVADASGHWSLPGPDELAQLSQILWRQGFAGRAVVLAAPPDVLLSGAFEVPPRSSGAPIDTIARAELARMHRLEPAAIECAWWELPAGIRETETTQVMAVGCEQSAAEALIDGFAAQDFIVRAIDAPSIALARAMRAHTSPPPVLAGILDIGWAGSLLAVVRNHTIVYERRLPELGLDSVLSRLKDKLAIDDETASYLLLRIGLDKPPPELADEVELVEQARTLTADYVDALAADARASAEYAGRRYDQPLAAILLSGEGASMPGVAPVLARRLKLDARTLAMSDLVQLRPALPDASVSPGAEGSVFALAAGLALHKEAW